jgi:C-terminal processing protease CtpA/Prc
MRTQLRIAAVVIASVFLQGSPFASFGHEIPSDAHRIERLVELGKLWGAIKYFHPYLAYREDIDWDAALVAAIPKVNAATNTEEYATAVQQMLDALGDPATQVIRKKPAGISVPGERQPSYESTADHVLIIRMNHYQDLEDFAGVREKMAAIMKEVSQARAIVFDLRALPPLAQESGAVSYTFSESGIAALLTSTPSVTPGERTRMHLGFAPQQGTTSGGYTSAFLVADGQRILPEPDAREVPVVFLLNVQSELPREALALQAAGKAKIVAEGSASDASVVTTNRVELTEGVEVQMRCGEIVYADGSGGFQPDLVVSASQASSDADQAFKAALALLQDFKAPPAQRQPLPARAAPSWDRSYAEMSYPALEYRLLACFRIWTIVNYFFPYKDLMQEDWDGVFRGFIPRMEKAENATEYHLAIAEMVTHLHDSHVFLNSPVLREYFGTASLPVIVRMIEGVPVITGLLDKEVTEAAGLHVGDVILKVDGEDAKDRMAHRAKYISASTPQRLMYREAMASLVGQPGSTAVLTVRDRENQTKEVKLPRKGGYRGDSERTGAVIRRLSQDIGYADLGRLEVSRVDDMFEQFKDTKAIIFDMRGYPKGTAWAIAPRLTEKDLVGAALVQCPVAAGPAGATSDEISRSMSCTFVQRIPQTDKWRYRGKTVMLIDERAISQAEHTGLFFEAANGTKFIGSHTAGANGDVTQFCVPGGITISFTGQSVRHADGRQLQRIGLVPDIEAKPTIKGIQSGRDEVLEAAVAYLDRELAKSQPKN